MTTFTIERVYGTNLRWCATMRVHGQFTNRWYYRTRIGAEISTRIQRWRSGRTNPTEENR